MSEVKQEEQHTQTRDDICRITVKSEPEEHGLEDDEAVLHRGAAVENRAEPEAGSDSPEDPQDRAVRFSCTHCDRSFPFQTSLKRHQKTVHHVCPVCGKRYRGRLRMARHLRFHVENGTLKKGSALLNDIKNPFLCTECGKKLPLESALRNHMKTHEGRLKCPHCGKRFKTENTFQNHLKYHSGPRPFKCSVCEETFASNTKLKTHKKMHRRRGPLACSFCGQMFKREKNLNAHLQIHGQTPGKRVGPKNRLFKCSICERYYNNSAMLRTHMKTHCEDRPFSCPFCEKRFVEQQDVARHQRASHHMCPLCSEGFFDRRGLKEHLRLHSPMELLEVEKPFVCAGCGRRFSSESNLQIHMVVHSNERPFHCSICEKSFKQESVLTVHMKRHRRTSQCHLCDFQTSGQLSPHLSRIHHICPVCEQRFSDRDALREHLPTHQQDGTPQRSSVHVCFECGELFFTSTTLQRHATEAHGSSEPQLQPEASGNHVSGASDWTEPLDDPENFV